MRPTEAFRDEHRELLAHVEQIRIAASEVTELAIEERETVVGRVLEFRAGDGTGPPRTCSALGAGLGI
jgi:hypothetical protein